MMIGKADLGLPEVVPGPVDDEFDVPVGFGVVENVGGGVQNGGGFGVDFCNECW